MNYKDIAKQELPFEGEFFLSRKKKYEEIVFFVLFYGGVKKQLIRHIKMVNDLGFDAFIFQLEGLHKDLLSFKLPINADRPFGMKHHYADQIEIMLNMVPGNKIVYAFSNPSASAIEAMDRRHCSDTIAMICDSGPTAHFLPSVYNLYTYDFKIKWAPVRLALTPLFGLCWSPYMHKDLAPQLDRFPQGFRVLSIRGWKDKLIPPADIDKVFEPHANLDWSKLSLPEAEHLTGLRDCRNDYIPPVKRFLESVATPVKE